MKDETLLFMFQYDCCDCFIIVVLTDNMKDVRNYFNKMKSLINEVASDENQMIAKKPIIMIFQLCNETEHIDDVKDNTIRKMEELEMRISELESLKKDDFEMALYPNFFFLFSSLYSNKEDSYREEGSPLINELIKQLLNRRGRDLCEIVTSILNNVRVFPCYKKSPYYISNLKTKLYIR